jgi:hypothetical protein
MSTCTVIINRAFRESQIVPSDVAPSTSQAAEALPLLQGIIERYVRAPIVTLWLGTTSPILQQRGQVMRDFTTYANSIAAPQDIYLNCVLTAAITIKLPPSPGDGARFVVIDVSQNFGSFPLTIQGNGNRVDGGTELSLATSGQGASLIYRRDLANWQLIPSVFQASNNTPYPDLYDDLFVIELAMRLNPRYGKEMPAITSQIYQDVRSMFKGRYMMTNSSASPDVLFDTWSGNTSWNIGGVF